MEQTVYKEFSRLIELEPEVLFELVEELNLYIKGGYMSRGYVYLMGFSTGDYKLGFSNTPPNRRKQVERTQQGLKVEVWIIHVIETDDMERLERDAAARLNLGSKYRGQEMWSLTQEDIDLFCSVNTCFYGDDYTRQAFIF